MTKKKSGRKKNFAPPTLGRRIMGWAITGAICLGLVYGAYDLFQFCVRSDLFMVKEVRILGTELLTKSEILREMDIPARVRLWQIEPERIEAALIRLNLVDSVQVRRVLPQTLAVEVLERKPVARWQDPATHEVYVLDEKRWLLATLGELEERMARNGISRREIGPLPLIVCDRSVRGWAPGDRLDVDGLEDVLNTYDVLWTRGENWIASIDRFEYVDALHGWKIKCREVAEEIRLGRTNLTQRLGKIDPVWRLLESEEIRVAYIDLRFDEQGVAIKPLNIGVVEWMELTNRETPTEKMIG
ncbi:MAG: FtsQ-type POTRA domain-containing protein [Candidatus Omnitrophica bacterium]|nr:FtsQ-type POTRA domain-containing protein [Candidatus Omnitrophota bacterium]MCB9784170.1 FtsQ-type POTRA domain-containing protein [Candidatus Omnitrophota bacterium]